MSPAVVFLLVLAIVSAVYSLPAALALIAVAFILHTAAVSGRL